MDTFWGLTSTGWTAIYTFLTAALLGVAVAAARYAKRQWKASRIQIEDSRQAQLEASRPYVIVTVEPSAASRALFDLVVRNIGRRPALNVMVRLNPPPRRANEDMREHAIADSKMLNEPIAMIAPNKNCGLFTIATSAVMAERIFQPSTMCPFDTMTRQVAFTPSHRSSTWMP